MKIELIESISLKDLHEQYFDELASESNRDCSRRDFLKLFTVTTAGLIVPSLYAQKTYGNPIAIAELTLAALTVIAEIIYKSEPVKGSIKIINNYFHEKEGKVNFRLVKSEPIDEDYKYASNIEWSELKKYVVPRRCVNTYEYETDSVEKEGRFKLTAACGKSYKSINNIIVKG